jgi:hypothetical protein
VEMSAGGRSPDDVKNTEVARQALSRRCDGEASGEDDWMRGFWRGRVDERLGHWAGCKHFCFFICMEPSDSGWSVGRLSVAFPLSQGVTWTL